MSMPERSDQEEIFERLRRGEINLRQAYKLLDRVEGGRPVEVTTKPRRGSRLSAAWAYLRGKRKAA